MCLTGVSYDKIQYVQSAFARWNSREGLSLVPRFSAGPKTMFLRIVPCRMLFLAVTTRRSAKDHNLSSSDLRVLSCAYCYSCAHHYRCWRSDSYEHVTFVAIVAPFFHSQNRRSNPTLSMTVKLDTSAKIFMVLAIPVFILDILLYVLSFKWIGKLQKPALYSFERGKATDTHGAPRSSTKDDKLVTSIYNGTTVYDMVKASTSKFKDHVAMRSRTFVDFKKIKETDKFPTKIFDDDAGFKDITYGELGTKIINFGSGLRGIGLEPQPETKNFDDAKGDFCMVIFEDTCCEWTIACQGAFSQKMTVATCYATLGDDAVISAVNETSATALFLNFKNATKFSKLADKMPSLKTIIASTHEMPAGTATPKSESTKVKIVSYEEVLAMGKKNNVDPVPPKVSRNNECRSCR